MGMKSIVELLEAMMLISFGISWPVSIIKSYTSQTAKGKSLFFLCMILLGYSCGIASKLALGTITYVLVLYVLNFILIAIDMLLYFRNKRLDFREISTFSSDKNVEI